MHVTNIKKDQFFETQTFYTRIPGKFKKVRKILLPENFSLTKVTKETVVYSVLYHFGLPMHATSQEFLFTRQGKHKSFFRHGQ